MKIKYQTLRRLTRWEVFQLYKDVLAYAEAVKAEKPELYLTFLEVFKTKFNLFDEALVQEKATSSVLPDAEEARDYGVRKIYSIAREYADYRVDSNKEAAAVDILTTFKPYGSGSEIARMAQDAETAILTNLLQDLAGEKVDKALVTLALKDMVALLEENNSLFGEERLAQFDEKSRYIAGAVKKSRDETEVAFKKFCEIVNALIIIEGATKYETLVPQINTRIKEGVSIANQRIERVRAERKKKADAAAATEQPQPLPESNQTQN